MIKPFFALMALMTFSADAQAGDFVCVGSGRFAAIDKKPLSLDQTAKDDRKKLLETSSGEVQVSLEKADDAGGPYLLIDVVDTDSAGVLSYRGAKGALTGSVMYIDSPESLIRCAPVKAAAPESIPAAAESKTE